MNKIYSIVFLAFFCLTGFAQQVQYTYSGNGRTGFGGPVGGGSLTITDDGTDLIYTITKGPGDFNDIMVVYIDSQPSSSPTSASGWSDTSLFNDTADGGRRAISNAGSGTLTFPPNFRADLAITVENGFVGLWDLKSPDQYGPAGITSLDAPTSLGTTFNASDSTISFMLAGFGGSGVPFDFIVTYGNGSANSDTAMFSSDESYGNDISTGNPGTNAFTLSNALRFYPLSTRFTTNGVGTLWSDPSSWNRNEVPQPGHPTFVLNPLTLDIDVTLDANDTPGTGPNFNAFSDLYVNPGVTLTLNGYLIIDNSFGNIGLIFGSDETGSAQFVNGTGAVITDDVTVQRFIPAATNNRRAYRFVTSSVNTSTSIYENWQTGGASVAGIGTHITGSNTGANGFDATVSGNPSMLEFVDNGSGYQWSFIDATNDSNTTDDNLVAGKAYNIFIRGDRNFDLSTNGNPNVDVVLPAVGTLNLSQSVSSGPLNPNEGGFDFVGNPYQATIDMTAVTKNGINPNFMYTWDPNAATNGAYDTVDISSGSTDPARYIEPGQAFFVVNNTIGGGPASIDFLASAKVPSATNGGTFSTPNTRPTMTVELWDNGTGGTRYDTAKFNFDGDNVVDAMDAPEIGNWEENFSINKNGTLLSLENRAMPTHEEIVLFDFSNVTHTDFELRMNHENLNVNLEAVLVDSYTNTEVTLSAGWNYYTFTVDPNDASSFANGRFSMKFVDTTLSTEQAGIISFEMYPNPNNGDVLNIHTQTSINEASVTFYSTLGQQMKTQNINSGMNQVDIKDLKAGIYLVQIKSGDHSTTQKLVIK